jgi:hypothetical protein
MDDWVRVFSGNRLAAHGLAEALDRAGVRVFEQHELGVAADVHARPAVTHVLVPPEERERAERIATHWQTHHAGRVEHLTGRLLRVLALSLIAPALWWSGAQAFPDRAPAPDAKGLGVVWLLGFVGVAQLESRRHRRERIDLTPTLD